MLYTDSTYSIRWTSLNVAQSALYHRTGNDTNWVLIATNLNSTDSVNSYNWRVPIGLVSDSLKIKVVSILDSTIQDVSDDYIKTRVYSNTGLSSMFNLKERIMLYPNPVADELTIVIPKEISISMIEITDINGKVVYTTKVGHDLLISVDIGQEFSNGFYTVRTLDNGRIISTHKLLIAH